MAYTSPKRSTTWFTLSLVGVSAAFARWATALLALGFVLLMPFFKGMAAYPPGVVVFSLAAALASLLIGPFFWWLFIIRPRQLTLSRGIFVGCLGSLVAHPLTWFLALVLASLGETNSILLLRIEHITLIEELQAIPSLSAYSLFLVGWLTTLIGGVVGGVLTGGVTGSLPAVVNGVVYIGSTNGYVYALNASNGTLRWRYQTGSIVFSSPAVVKGVVYVGSEDSHVYALSA